jgi:hypothetical protein
MPNVPTPANTISQLRERISTLTGSDPVLQIWSPEGTAADRRYQYVDTYAAGYYCEQTNGPHMTVRHLSAILLNLVGATPYSLQNIRHGTGWAANVKFVPVNTNKGV